MRDSSIGMNIVVQYPFQFCVVLCCLGFLVHRFAQRRARDRQRNPAGLPFPPGPRGYPIIGNMFDMPTVEQWRVYAEWAKVYGDVLSFEVLGQRMVVLNSFEAAQDLLEKRSAIYSDRVKMNMAFDLMGCDYLFALMRYGPSWRKHRRSFNEHFNEDVLWKYTHIQSREARAFLYRLLRSPEEFMSHVRETLSSILMNVAYGIQVTGRDDPYIVNLEKVMVGVAAAGVPGSFMVDFIPALKYLPSWFPGGGFKKVAASWAELNRKVLENPFNHVHQQIKMGNATPSIAAEMISALPESNNAVFAEDIKIAHNIPAIAYLAGADTSISALQSFILALAMHPKVQKRVQAELDTVIGPHRLPELNDRPSLPYVNATIIELIRWSTIAPLAVSHVSTKDDVYRGYFIPKGSIVFGNVWAINHDQEVYDNPEELRPERYLKNGKLDTTLRQPDCTFGFGRRMCPGRFFSDNGLFLIVSSMLYAFNITPALDDNGVPVPLSNKLTDGIIVYPAPFKVDIKPRSADVEALVRAAVLGDN